MAQHKASIIVEKTGLSLLSLVAERVGAEHAATLIARGAVWIDRHRARDASSVPPAGAQIDVHFPPSGRYDTVTLTDEDVLWEDDVLLAINKRPGWHTNYNPWDMWGSLRYALQEWITDRDGIERPVHLLHQLDRDTSGVLLASKASTINARMQQIFLSSEIQKSYLTLASGNVEADVFEVQTGHGRGQSGLFRVYPLEEVGRVLPFGKQRVRHMHTRFEVMERFGGVTLSRVIPVTGRTHQIRLHLQHLGFPIVGDARYGGPTALGDLEIIHHLLHAARLQFPHPRTHEQLTIQAPLPPLWQRALAALRTA